MDSDRRPGPSESPAAGPSPPTAGGPLSKPAAGPGPGGSLRFRVGRHEARPLTAWKSQKAMLHSGLTKLESPTISTSTVFQRLSGGVDKHQQTWVLL